MGLTSAVSQSQGGIFGRLRLRIVGACAQLPIDTKCAKCAAGDCRKLNTSAPLVTAATLPRLRLVSLYGCTAGSRAAEGALSELSYALRCAASVFMPKA